MTRQRGARSTQEDAGEALAATRRIEQFLQYMAKRAARDNAERAARIARARHDATCEARLNVPAQRRVWLAFDCTERGTVWDDSISALRAAQIVALLLDHPRQRERWGFRPVGDITETLRRDIKRIRVGDWPPAE